jgi:hypothetical protein
MSDPAAHLPASRRQSADAHPARRTPKTSHEPRLRYLRMHWRGELPLAAAVIVSAALVWGAVQIVSFGLRQVSLVDSPLVAAAMLLLQVVLLLGGAVWWGAGVMRSAANHVGRGGSASLAVLAGAVGLGAFFWAAAFWWQSARYVLPDVWATLAGDAVPAAVGIERVDSAPRVLVSGTLEFGTTRALRAVLDANPGIGTIRFESRGGRVAEGLALGRLILDRNKDTLVTGECSSACVTAFAGGARRVIGPNARLGLHSVGGKGVSTSALAAANRRSDTFIANRGVDVYLLEEGAAVSNDDIWFPPASALLRAGLATEPQ